MTSSTLTVAGYVALAVAMVGLHLAGRRRPDGVPTAGGVMSWLMATQAGRWTVLVCWWWLGWHLFVR